MTRHSAYITALISFQLYTEFIAKFEGKLSQIRVALLASMVARLHVKPEDAIQFLQKVLLARIRLGTEAALCLDMDVVILKLKSGAPQGAKEAKEALADAKEKTSSMQITDPIVFSRFFKATTEYRKVSNSIISIVSITCCNTFKATIR
jgi:hypothetical protein